MAAQNMSAAMPGCDAGIWISKPTFESFISQFIEIRNKKIEEKLKSNKFLHLCDALDWCTVLLGI